MNKFRAIVATLGVATCAGIVGLAQQAAPVDISIYFVPGVPEAPLPPADWEVYKTIREKLGVNIKVIQAQTGQDGSTKLAALGAANDLPDLMQVDDRNLFYKFVDQGLLAEADPIVRLMPERAKEKLSNARLIQLASVNKVRYGLLERNLFRNRAGLIIRKDWLRKLGLKEPKTLEEFLAVAKAFTERDPDGNGKKDTYGFGLTGTVSNYGPGNGLASGFTDAGGFEFVYGAYGVGSRWNISNTSAKSNIKDPRYFQATQFVKKILDAKVVDPDWVTVRYGELGTRWKQGRYGMFFYDFCATFCVQNYPTFDDVNPEGELAFIDPPVGPTGKSSVGLMSPIGTMYAVSKKAAATPKGAAIARFLEWANSDEGYLTLVFGKKGENYNIDANGNLTYDGIAPGKTFNTREMGQFAQFKAFSLNGSDRELKLRYPDFKTKNGRLMQPLSFYNAATKFPTIDTTPQLIIQPATNQADIERYISEGLIQFVLGQKKLDSSSWGGFVDGLKGLNFDAYEEAGRALLRKNGFVK